MLAISVTAVGYAALLVYVILWGDGRARRAWLLAYVLFSFAVTAAYAMAARNSTILGYGAGLPTALFYLASLGLLGALTLTYIGWKWDWVWLALAAGAGLLLLFADVLGLLPVMHAATWRDALASARLPLPIAFAALWGLGHVFNFALTFVGVTRARLPLHANHLLWWLIVLAVVAVGEATAVWAAEPLASVGRVLRLAGVAGAVYGVVVDRLVDVRNTFRSSVGNAVFVIITAALTLTGIAIAQLLLSTLSGLTAFVAVAGIAVLLALVYQALRGFTERLVRRAVLRVGYDPANVAAQYAQRIARQLRFDELAATAANTLRSSVEASKGGLVLLTPNGGAARADVYAGLGQFPAEACSLSQESPVLRALRRTQRPLLQYNIDVGKGFKDIAPEEHDWLRQLNMDVFVPILDGDELSGMLAVGQRISGDPYRRSELDLMMAIADQTSVALNNARLFENMRALNDEMKALNRNLMATNERLAEMDRVKSDFITIASHELRTPLSQMRGYADLIDTLAQQNRITPEQVANLASSILGASDRLDEIIGMMLDASQIDVEAMQLSFDDTSLERVLRKSVESYAAAMRERGQSLTVQGLRALPSVRADKRRLVQAFRQLVGNAIKYTPDGGRIEIRARHLPRDERRSEAVEVQVIDTGVGIDPKYHELVFEKFFRVGSTDLHSSGSTKFMGAGPGLGLPIAKGVVLAHGGEIWVESEGFDMDKCPGTTVHVILPVKPPAISAEAAAELQKEVLSFDPEAWGQPATPAHN